MEDVTHAIHEPRRVTELDGDTHVRGKRPERPVEPVLILGTGRWQLHDHRSEVGSKVGRAFHEQVHGSIGIAQAADVREVAAQLGCDDKARRHRVPPPLEVLGLGQTVEAVVQLDGVEHLGIAPQPVALRQPPGVEHLPPVGVLPARRPDPDLVTHSSRSGRPAISRSGRRS